MHIWFLILIDLKILVFFFPYNKIKDVESSGEGAFPKLNKLLRICPTKSNPYFELDSE